MSSLMTDADLLHLENTSAPISDEERTQAAAEIRRLRTGIDRLQSLINNPHTDEFLPAVRLEAAHQRDRWGDAHDRGKSTENWYWLVGYLAGKCLRAVITSDKAKALHHTISSAAALANWYEAIKRDQTGTGLGADRDLKPVEIARFEGARNGSLETSEADARELR